MTLWFLYDEPRLVWKRKLANPVKFAQFSPDATLIVTTALYDRLVKVWRRLAFGADDVRFEVSYLAHPDIVTGMHWRRPCHRDQSLDNVLYTLCADNRIRVWTVMDHHALSALQPWKEIDMNASVQPRHAIDTGRASRRYGFILDGRDFCGATERAVQKSIGNKQSHGLEHVIEVANKSPEICVVINEQGNMSAWALEDVGGPDKAEMSTFNILHVEDMKFSFTPDVYPEEDYVQISAFQRSTEDDLISFLVHHFDGRIEWFDSEVDVLFDPAPRKDRMSLKATWTGHGEPIKKLVRNDMGHTLVSRTDDNKAIIWRQRHRHGHSRALVRESSLYSDKHIRRTTVIEHGDFLVNLHYDAISLWDVRSFHAKRLAVSEFHLSSKPLCVLQIPTADLDAKVVYIAAIGADMTGIAWEVSLPASGDQAHTNGQGSNYSCLRQFCTFDFGIKEDIYYILPVDPAGPKIRVSEFFDVFATDVALTYTHSGIVRTWTAKVDQERRTLDWLLTSTVETGISNPSRASGSSIRKAALVDEDQSRLTIWDMNGAQLEYEEHYPHHVIRDLDWTSTPDMQSILAVGFPRKVILLSQLRYDYLDARPSWTQIQEVQIRDLTPHPIGDSCWLSHGHLVVGAGNQLFVYDKKMDVSSRLVSELRIPSHGTSTVDLFEVVNRLNGPLPVFHPQFLAQCILGGKMQLVHSILMTLNRKLKFYTEGDKLDGFLDMPLELFYKEDDSVHKAVGLSAKSPSYDGLSAEDEESIFLYDNVASALKEALVRIALPHLSSQEQFRLADTVDCITMVEKHRRSIDDNAARYLLFFRQHMLRRSQRFANKNMVSWREIAFAFHSESQDILTDQVSRLFSGKMRWKAARESGLFMWLSDSAAVVSRSDRSLKNAC